MYNSYVAWCTYYNNLNIFDQIFMYYILRGLCVVVAMGTEHFLKILKIFCYIVK